MAINNSADRCYDAAMELRAAFLELPGIGHTTLAELASEERAFGCYIQALRAAQVAYHAPSSWLGPLGMVLGPDDQAALTKQLLPAQSDD